jgi:hypothetical protein
VDQRASRTCADLECRRVALERSHAVRRERFEKLKAEAIVLRDQAAATHGIQNPESFTLVVIPRNDARSTKQKLRRHLREMLDQAVRHQDDVTAGTADPRPPLPPVDPPPADMAGVLLSACISCRGDCCRTGGEHAYLTSDSMLAYIDEHPDDTPDAVIDAYMAFIPSRTIERGCVYQGAKGCALPREMRSNTCNRFYCASLTAFRSEGMPDTPPRAFFAPVQDHHFAFGQFAAPGFVQLVRHRPGQREVP